MIELRIIAPDGAERLMTVERNQIFFGRHPANDVLMAHPTISLRHGRICFFRGTLWVEDLKSALGTRLNGETLSTARPLSTQDTVEVGEFRLILSRAVEAPEPQAPDAGRPASTASGNPADAAQGGSHHRGSAHGADAHKHHRSSSSQVPGTNRPAPLPVGLSSSTNSDALSMPAVNRMVARGGAELSDAWRTNQSGSWRAGFGRADGGGEPSSKQTPSGSRSETTLPGKQPLGGASTGTGGRPPSPVGAPPQAQDGVSAQRGASAGPTLEQTRAPEAPTGSVIKPGSAGGRSDGGTSTNAWSEDFRSDEGAAAQNRPDSARMESSRAVEARRPAPPPAPAWVPKVPRSLDDTGLRPSVVVDLVLKSIYMAGELTGYDLREQLKLPYDLVEPVIAELRRDKLIDVKGGGGSFGSISMTYMVTIKGTEAIRQILDRNRYVGPAPVTMAEYLKCVEAQSIRKLKVPRRQLVNAFQHLVVEDYIYDGIGPALNSGTAILFYGPPGNGKTAICQAMVDCLGDGIYIPHAIEADGNVIKLFDEHNHKPIVRSGGPEADVRYVYCQRPLIMVGGELTLDMLDMSYSSDAKYYEAPFQMKANGGILLVDDFGRQRVSPTDLLNRWIVPLESQIDFISLITGRKLKVPFDVFVAFATNLNPADLVDDAFLRRVRYKLEVQRPSQELFRTLFMMACDKHRVPFQEQSYQLLMKLYQQDGRPMNACEPRNLVSAVESLADYFEREPALEEEFVRRAYTGYFTRFSSKAG